MSSFCCIESIDILWNRALSRASPMLFGVVPHYQLQNFPWSLVDVQFSLLLDLGIIQDIKREKWVLTDEGKTYAASGSPEVQLFLAIPPEGIPLEELQVSTVLFY